MGMNDDIAKEMHERYPWKDGKEPPRTIEPTPIQPHPLQARYTMNEVRAFIADIEAMLEASRLAREERAFQKHVDRTEGMSY